MPVNKAEAPVRDRAGVEITVKITRENHKDAGYSSGDVVAYAKVEHHAVLAGGRGDVEDNHSTFSNLLEEVLLAAKSDSLSQLSGHVDVLRKAREDREAKERAAEAAEQG